MDLAIDHAAKFKLEASSDQFDEGVKERRERERERPKVIRPVQFQSVSKSSDALFRQEHHKGKEQILRCITAAAQNNVEKLD